MGLAVALVAVLGVGGTYAFMARTPPPPQVAPQAQQVVAPPVTAPPVVTAPPTAAAVAPPVDATPKRVKLVIMPPDAVTEIEGTRVFAKNGIIEITGAPGRPPRQALKGKTETEVEVIVTESGAMPPRSSSRSAASRPRPPPAPPRRLRPRRPRLPPGSSRSSSSKSTEGLLHRGRSAEPSTHASPSLRSRRPRGAAPRARRGRRRACGLRAACACAYCSDDTSRCAAGCDRAGREHGSSDRASHRHRAPASAGAGASEAAPPSEATKAEARIHFEKGLRLLQEEAWAAALAEFLISRELFPTRSATTNAAVALRKLQRFDEALDMYEVLLRDFANVPAGERAAAQRAIAELRERVGTIDITGAEPGASIVVGGQARGEYPPVTPLRVSAGTHLVRVVKEGFEPFRARADVAGGQTARVVAKMRALTASGRLKVSERAGRTLDVLVDNVVVGQTPWEGVLAVGSHTVLLHGKGKLGTQPAAAEIKSQQITALTLVADDLESALRVDPTPAGASVAIDSVPVGHGVWIGRLKSGPHQIELSADGFLTTLRKVNIERGGRGSSPCSSSATPTPRCGRSPRRSSSTPASASSSRPPSAARSRAAPAAARTRSGSARWASSTAATSSARASASASPRATSSPRRT